MTEDLQQMGLAAGDAVLVHTSLRAIGKIAGGAATLLRAFRAALGPEGTLLVPAFTFETGDPANWREPPPEAALPKLRAAAPVFDPAASPVSVAAIGAFAEFVRRQPDARRSDHPLVSFAAVGANAAFLTQNVPFHYPLGSESPLARLYQLNGLVLLLGVGQCVNTSLHLAEIWADAPYIHRSTTLKTGLNDWTTMRGIPECSEGFRKVEPLLRQGRILHSGYVGNALSQLMRQRQLVSMAVAMLRGDGSALLCDDPDCSWCRVAYKLTAQTR